MTFVVTVWALCLAFLAAFVGILLAWRDRDARALILFGVAAFWLVVAWWYRRTGEGG